MNYKRLNYWKVIYFPDIGARRSPKDFIEGLPKEESAIIYRTLRTLEKLEIITQWSKLKSFSHDETKLLQLSVTKKYRLYLYQDTEAKPKKIVVCYACRKQGQKAKNTDLNRAATSIRNYINRNG